VGPVRRNRTGMAGRRWRRGWRRGWRRPGRPWRSTHGPPPRAPGPGDASGTLALAAVRHGVLRKRGPNRRSRPTGVARATPGYPRAGGMILFATSWSNSSTNRSSVS
jgi:hypothetical protein